MEERYGNMTDRLTADLVDCSGPQTYPIVSYTYFIVRKQQTAPNCSAVVELVRYIEWFTTTQEALLHANGQGMAT